MSIALVAQSTNNAASNILTVTIPTPGVGNALIACIAGFGAGTTVVTVTGGGCTWSQYGSITANGTPAFLWVGLNSSGIGTAIVITLSAGTNTSANVSEWSGIVTSSATDGAVTAGIGTSTTPATGNYTSTNAQNLIIAMIAHGASTTVTTAPSSPWISLTSAYGIKAASAAYQIVSSTGTFSAGWTVSGSTGWSAVIGGLKASAATFKSAWARNSNVMIGSS